MFGNQLVGDSIIVANDGSDGLAGAGFGFNQNGNDLTGFAWDGFDGYVGVGSISVPPASIPDTAGSNSGDVRLLVGRVQFATPQSPPGYVGEYMLYQYLLGPDGKIEGGNLVPILDGPIQALLFQSDFSVLNLTRQANANYDEVRIGTTLASVLPVIPKPSKAILIAFGGLGLLLRRRRVA